MIKLGLALEKGYLSSAGTTMPLREVKDGDLLVDGDENCVSWSVVEQSQ